MSDEIKTTLRTASTTVGIVAALITIGLLTGLIQFGPANNRSELEQFAQRMERAIEATSADLNARLTQIVVDQDKEMDDLESRMSQSLALTNELRLTIAELGATVTSNTRDIGRTDLKLEDIERRLRAVEHERTPE